MPNQIRHSTLQTTEIMHKSLSSCSPSLIQPRRTHTSPEQGEAAGLKTMGIGSTIAIAWLCEAHKGHVVTDGNQGRVQGTNPMLPYPRRCHELRPPSERGSSSDHLTHHDPMLSIDRSDRIRESRSRSKPPAHFSAKHTHWLR